MNCLSIKLFLLGFRVIGSQFKLESYNGGFIIKTFNDSIKIEFLE
jgi:hypothetical protein